VLIIDLDPQGNTTSGLGVAKKQLKYTTKDVLTGEASVKEAILETEFNNLWLIPTNISLASAEYELYDLCENDELPYRMKEAIWKISRQYLML
jgi:chromosome partitioning protein